MSIQIAISGVRNAAPVDIQLDRMLLLSSRPDADEPLSKVERYVLSGVERAGCHDGIETDGSNEAGSSRKRYS